MPIRRQALPILTTLSALCCGLLAASVPALAAKTLVYCSEGSPDTLNPQLSSSGTTFDATSVPMHDRLVALEPGTTNLVPGLAESWEVSPDGLAYTFKLRRGVKFHSSARFKPTRDMNADDVLFSFNRMALPDHPYHKLSGGKTFPYFEDKEIGKIVDRLEKVDDHTVRFRLRHREAAFLIDMGYNFASILSKEYADRLAAVGAKDVLDREPIGTGPFQFVSYQKDAVIRYKAFDQYWGGRPKIDNLVIAITPDASVRHAKLKAGECHVMALPKPADLAAMKADPALNVMEMEGLNVGYIAFNVGKKPFDSKAVRQALNMAVDKPGLLKNIYLGSAVAAKNPMPSSLWAHNGKIQDWPYDLAKAKALLAKAGYPNGFEMDLWYLPVTRPYNPDGRRMGELLQADWAKIGVKVKLVSYEWTEYLKRTKNGEHAAVMLGWSGGGDPDEFLGPLLSCEAVKGGGNMSRWCHKEFDDLYQQAKVASKQADRAKLYLRAQEIFHEEAPWIPLAHATLVTPLRKEVKGYVVDRTALHYFHKVDLVK